MVRLFESLLTGEFNFGFELEAYTNFVNNGNSEKYVYYDEDLEKDITNENWDSEINSYLKKWWGSNAQMIYDGSLELFGFEFPSPILSFTPSNIKKTIEFLSDLNKSPLKIYTDESCGFHIHFSFPTMTKEDMIWIVCNIALDKEFQDKLLFFTTTSGVKLKFFDDEYASTDFLYKIRDSIINEKYDNLGELLSSEKYRVLRFHPADNIEWRGPRNFLNKSNIKDIKNFFILLYYVISNIIKILDKKEINKVSRENFFKLLPQNQIISTKSSERESKTVDNLAKIIIKKPILATKHTGVKADWYRIFYNIHNAIELKFNEHRDDTFLTPIRYKHFENPLVLAGLLRTYPEFYKYATENDPQTFVTRKNIEALADEYQDNFKISKELLDCISTSDLCNLIKNGFLTTYMDSGLITELQDYFSDRVGERFFNYYYENGPDYDDDDDDDKEN